MSIGHCSWIGSPVSGTAVLNLFPPSSGCLWLPSVRPYNSSPGEKGDQCAALTLPGGYPFVLPVTLGFLGIELGFILYPL
jgi:hypothetical protein